MRAKVILQHQQEKPVGDIPYTAYFSKKSYIEENEEIIKKFVRAIYKGQKWVENHTNREVAEAIVDFFPDTELNLLEKVIARYRQVDVWKTDPILKEEDFERLQTVMQEAGELSIKAPYEKIVNNKYAEEIIK